MEIKHKYRIKQIIVTHIDEYWANHMLTIKKVEKSLDNVSFCL